ncbi:MAG: fluoride efflux transporter FluC [Acidimicrobiales bacterium]
MPVLTGSVARRRPEPAFRILAIAAGGALGTLARYGVGRAVVVSDTAFPWATFAVNVAGSLALGVIVTLATERWPPTRFVRPFAAIGFCGGFTTFSTLMVESMRRAELGSVGLAALYLAVSLAAGTAAAAAGVLMARGRGGGQRGGASPDPDSMTTLSGDPAGASTPHPPSSAPEGSTP